MAEEIKFKNVKELICNNTTNQEFLTYCEKSYTHESYHFLKACYSLLDNQTDQKTYLGLFSVPMSDKEIDKKMLKAIREICNIYIIPSENDFTPDKGKMTVNLIEKMRSALILLYQAEKPDLNEFRKALETAMANIENLLNPVAMKYQSSTDQKSQIVCAPGG